MRHVIGAIRMLVASDRLARMERLAIDAERNPLGGSGEALIVHQAVAQYFEALDFYRGNFGPEALAWLEHAERMLRCVSSQPMPPGDPP